MSNSPIISKIDGTDGAGASIGQHLCKTCLIDWNPETGQTWTVWMLL